MKNIFSIIKDVLSEVKDFFVKLWRTSRFLLKKFLYFLKIILLWIKYYFYQFFNYIYYAFVYLIDGIKWLFRKIKAALVFIWNSIKRFFRFIYDLLANLIHYIYVFLEYIVIKLKSFFQWLFKTIKKLILEFPQFLLFLLTFIFVLIIALFNSLYIFIKLFVNSLLNRNYRFDDTKVIAIKPLYILPVNLIDGYLLALKSLTSKKKKVLSADTETAFGDLVAYTSVAWLLVLGAVLLVVAIVVTLPLAIIFGFISILSVPKDESKFLEYFKKRLVLSKTEIETSFKLKPTVFQGYKISWASKNHDIISDEGILNNINAKLSSQDVVNVGLVVKVEKETFNSFEFEVPVRYNSAKDALLNTYRNVMLPEKINDDINFDDFKTSPEVEIEVESLYPKIINNEGVILNPNFTDKIKVYFKVKIIYENYYMKKRIFTYIINEDAEDYLTSLLKNTPDKIEIRKGRIKLKAHKAVKTSFSANEEKVVNNNGFIYPSDYDVENIIEVAYSINDLTVKKEVALSRKGSKKGLKKELKQIVLPQVKSDVSLIELPQFTELGIDGFSYEIKWYKDGELVTNIETETVIKKPYVVYLMAKINVNGIDGLREMRLVVPRRSTNFACKYDLDHLEPLITFENYLYLPKRGKDFKATVFWISKTPTIVSSKGVLRKSYMIEQTKNKVAVIKAIVIYRTKTMTKDFVFEIENNKFKDYKPIEIVQDEVNIEGENS